MRARNFPGRLLLSLVLMLIAASAMLFLTAIAANNDEIARAEPAEILPQLQEAYEQATEQVDFPVLLPTSVPGLGTEFWLAGLMFANSYGPANEGVTEDSSLHYEFSVDTQDGCGGSGACSSGSIGGEVVTAGTQPIEAIHSYVDDYLNNPDSLPMSAEPMGTVELSGGREGIFVPWVATAQCTEARVYWEQPFGDETYRYYVGIECGDRADVVELANNVIANTEGF